MLDDIDWFASRLLDFHLAQDQVRALFSHYELLKRWNLKINLTSIRSPEETVIRHYCESLFFAAHLPESPAGTTIVDIGSGAGFPGVPMAVLRPDWEITLVESRQRKAVFLRESTRDLRNISIISERAERLNLGFSCIVARGVTPEVVLALAPRLAMRVGLLIGAADFVRLQRTGEFVWLDPVQMPWGDRKLCVFGVSRGT